jgi:hypothetical protein
MENYTLKNLFKVINMDEDIENLIIDMTVLREKNRVLENRLDDITMKFKRHINIINAHEV